MLDVVLAHGRALDPETGLDGVRQYASQFAGHVVRPPTTLHLKLDVEQLIDMNEESFEFELEFGMHVMWEDPHIGAKCYWYG